MKILIKDIQAVLERKLRRINFSSKESRFITDEYVGGELQGKSSHGIFAFVGAFQKMKRRPRKKFKLIKNNPAYAYLAGNNDIGQIVAGYAIELAIKKAQKTGIAMVGGGNIQSFLRPGTWAAIAAKKGMIGLCFNFGGGPLMAPTGAREPILSTNPIGIGIPYKPFPIVLDMAVSNRAFYHVRLARALGKKIDKDWGIDRFGHPTTDPNKLVAVLPFGGYKGYALGLALEILTGPLVRTKVGKSSKRLRGFLFVVINPLSFTSRKEFNTDVSKLIRDIKTAKKIKGVKEILIPGERAYRDEQRNLKKGYLNVDNAIVEQIQKL